MTKQLNTDEMLDVLHAINHPSFSKFRGDVEQIAEEMADAIAESLDVECGSASFEGTSFAGTCVPFWAKAAGQPCPEAMQEFDEGEWSDPDGNDLDPETGAPL